MILTMASSNTEQIPINKLITDKKSPPLYVCLICFTFTRYQYEYRFCIHGNLTLVHVYAKSHLVQKMLCCLILSQIVTHIFVHTPPPPSDSRFGSCLP